MASDDDEQSSGGDSNVGIIIGAVIGGAVAIGALIFIILYIRKQLGSIAKEGVKDAARELAANAPTERLIPFPQPAPEAPSVAPVPSPDVPPQSSTAPTVPTAPHTLRYESSLDVPTESDKTALLGAASAPNFMEDADVEWGPYRAFEDADETWIGKLNDPLMKGGNIAKLTCPDNYHIDRGCDFFCKENWKNTCLKPGEETQPYWWGNQAGGTTNLEPLDLHMMLAKLHSTYNKPLKDLPVKLDPPIEELKKIYE